MNSELFNFQYQSSPVDWCENNYYFNNIICEFNNSWSSMLYSLSAMYIFYKYYIFIKNPLIFGMILAAFFVGITSFLFHSTLSITGQILDLGSIVVFIISSDLVINKKYLLSILISIFFTISLFFPTYCRFILFSIGMIIIKNTIENIRNHHIKLLPYFKQNLKQMFIAIYFWILDMVLCDHLLFGTHFIWHILSTIALHNLIILTILMYNKKLTLKNKNFSLFNILFFLKKKKKIVILVLMM